MSWLALSTRHHEGIPAAHDTLPAAMVRSPEAAAISFHLAGYTAHSGHLNDARDCPRWAAFELGASLRMEALKDPDLGSPWQSLRRP